MKRVDPAFRDFLGCWFITANAFRDHRSSSASTVRANTSIPLVMSDSLVISSGQWLRPSTDGTNSMAAGTRLATCTASWVAPLGIEAQDRPVDSAASM